MMKLFKVEGVKDYRDAKFPERTGILSARKALARILGSVKVTFGLALLTLILSLSSAKDACAGYSVLPPKDITGQEEPVKLNIADFAKQPKVYDTQRVLVTGKIEAFETKSPRGGRPIKSYRIEAEGVTIELMGEKAKDFVGKSVTVQGYIRIFGQPCKDGSGAFRLSIEKIIP